ncbi:lactate/malate family dehydrogenase [Myceligenerans xiligouense]|uniref:Malate dehydrogenase n=1 Tax=Myceligenerans xiligouense TaxID=253184 RepID=A0A3N4YVE9_9MICO|nr:lactate dehydrogenase [Myceligenerans xiligouense]RPF23374.1 malate dehydrogenase [Myceligenerans xiligouense]
MDVSVVGATGDIGRQICTQLIADGLLTHTSRLQLVGRPDGASAATVHGLRADLIDAFDERAPLLDVALSPRDVVADVVVLAAGRTAPAQVGANTDRTALAQDNRAVFEQYADALATHGSGREVVIVVSNPVELGVAVLAERLGRHRVIGMGAWLDSLRFQREIAMSLGVRRHRVDGYVGGQHGEKAVPLWSTVRIAGLSRSERTAAVARLRQGRTLDTFFQEIGEARGQLDAASAVHVGDAFTLVDSFPPDVRTVARSFMTHTSGAKTATGTAAATVDLVETLLDGRQIVVAGQVALADEILGDDGEPVPGRVLGVPVILGPDGWTRVILDPLPDDEARALAESGRVIDAMLDALDVPDPRATSRDRIPASSSPSAADGEHPEDPAARYDVEIEVTRASDPGVVATLTGVFADRGVEVDAVATNPRGSVGISFRAPERMARSLVRTLERLAMARKVVAHRAES